MTASEREESRAGPPAAEAETSSGSELAPGATAAAGTPETARRAVGTGAAPADAQQLQQEIERTREQLGDTVQQLVARADVKSMARAKGAQMSGIVRSKTVQARQYAADRTGTARSQFTGKATAIRDNAISAGGTRKDQLRNQVTTVSAPVWAATPEPVRRAVTKGAGKAGERWIPLTVAAGGLIVLCLALRQWRRQQSKPAVDMNDLDT
jgi:Protein of unknown function (DUF3618)